MAEEHPSIRLAKRLEEAMASAPDPKFGTVTTPAFSNNVSWTTTEESRKPWASRDDGSHP